MITDTILGRAIIGVPMIIALLILWRILWKYYNIKYDEKIVGIPVSKYYKYDEEKLQ